jgi:hypothetical protein
VSQDPRGDDRQLLRERGAEAGGEENEEQTEIAELLDERSYQFAPQEDSSSGNR